MIQIEVPKEGTRVISADRLRTMAQYAKTYIKKDGTVGCAPTHIKALMDLGKLDVVEIAGQRFIILPEEDTEIS